MDLKKQYKPNNSDNSLPGFAGLAALNNRRE
jgi:hypothetical protein